MSRQDHIDFDRNYCAHYNPQPGMRQQNYCSLGCGASELMKRAREKGEPNMSPCIGGHTASDVLALCPKWERRSMEHAESRADSIEQMFKKLELSGPFISQWREKPKPKQDRRDIVECPVCKGRLHLSQSSYNGHVHAHCETKGCISFME